MKGAESFVTLTSRAQYYPTLGDDFNNIASAPNLVNCFAWHSASGLRGVHGESASLFEGNDGYALTALTERAS